MMRHLLILALVALSPNLLAQAEPEADALMRSVEQLRSSIGRWAVVTEFLDSEGAVSRAVEGTYEFAWVVPDRVVSGRTAMPALNQAAGILFYINEKKRHIEMVSVGRDGNLWIMTGPLGGEVRHSQEFQTPRGETRQLRFTRFNVSADSFESKMEYTNDGGASWKPGNHQLFRRVKETN